MNGKMKRRSGESATGQMGDRVKDSLALRVLKVLASYHSINLFLAIIFGSLHVHSMYMR